MKSAIRKLGLLVLVVFVAVLFPVPALTVAPASSTPSFNCSLAKDVIDKTICGDAELAEADAVMGRLYSAARVSAFGHGPSDELAVQREWLKSREDCRVPDRRVYRSRTECLSGRYADRNHELAVASLFTEPPLALGTLRKLDPDAAPLYEAIVEFASEPTGSNWTTSARRPHMLQLLQPYFDRLIADEDLRYGKDILDGDGIRVPADALKSEKKFVEFLQIASAYLRSDPIPRPLPCAAIVRHSKLLDASGPIFGSTLDSFIFYPDCADTLPPLPKLNRLVKQINDTWPDCQGSIRFSAYRSFGWAVNGARVASANEINEFAKSRASGRSVRMPRLNGVSAGLVATSIDELSAYYQTYQKTTPRAARAFATSKIRDVVASGHNCND